MSKRTNLTRILSPLGPSRSCFLMVLCILAALAVGTAQASTVVRINHLGPIQPGDTIIVPVTLDSVTGGLDITGFDFLIAWEPTAFRLIETQEGQLLTDCGWEYFDARSSTMTDWNGLPVNIPMVRIVSVADLNNGDIHPSCNATASGELVRLVFEASSHPINHGTHAHVQFLWNDCGDNAMALDDGTLLISDQVFRYGSDWSEDSEFPTWFGAPDECPNMADSGGPIREVDYYNGVVMFADSDTSSNADAAIYIAGDQVAWPGLPTAAMIGIDNLRSPWEASGFDLLIQYDNTVLTFSLAEMGYNLFNWNWEYFNYVDDPAQGLIRLVAIADINNGDIHPSDLINRNCVIALLRFEVIDNPANIGRTFPLKFRWNDCGDNAFASAPDGDSLYVSKDVYDEYGFIITAEDTMPTFHGVPQGCISASTIRRSVDFFHGAIQVATEDPTFVYTNRGDINLNWVPNEIADLVLFSNYFFYGLGVFNVNVEAQVAATDVNDDGLVLTLDDFIYLHRVIIGDVLPIPGKSPATDTAYIVQDTTAKSLTLVYSDSLAILYLTFNGVIDTVQFESETHDVGYISDASSTRMMVSPKLDGSEIHSLESGFLLSYTGNVQIATAQAAYDGINPIMAIAQIGQGEQCCVNRGNINHDPEGVLDISDLVYFVSFMFDLGSPPPCPGEADINANGPIEIGDLVWLVDYMFNSGPAPVPCP